jgi:phosphatidylethanolamine/phosphatidyl-N-methylethanolamine N-methyltransferase
MQSFTTSSGSGHGSGPDPRSRTRQAVSIALPIEDQRLARIRFFQEFLRNPFATGALCPSSPVLSKAVADACDFAADDLVVELGPGTGSFTELLLQRLGPRGRLLAFEINATNVEILRRRFPLSEIIHDSAENLVDHLGHQRARCVISGLAWSTMLPALQDRILQAVLDSLTPVGQFVAFAYVHAFWVPTARRFRRSLLRTFGRVTTTPIVWRNLPPAYVYRCWRA